MEDPYVYIRLGRIVDDDVMAAALDLDGGIVDPSGTSFKVGNPLGSVNFIWQILDLQTGYNIEAEIFRSFVEPKIITVFFRNNFAVPSLRYRLLILRIV